jgi:hypothetical protein
LQPLHGAAALQRALRRDRVRAQRSQNSCIRVHTKVIEADRKTCPQRVARFPLEDAIGKFVPSFPLRNLSLAAKVK